MRSEHFRSTEEFAAACREYVSLVHAMSKISSAQSALRAEQKKAGEAIHVSLMKRGRKEHLCDDLTRLEIRTSTRRTPIKKDYVIAEILNRFGKQDADNIWNNIVERRPVVETERLAYESEADDDDYA